MATVILFDAARMQAIEDGTVTTGLVDSFGHLILVRHDASSVDAGKVTADNLADASTTVPGIVELATVAEAIAVTDPNKAITPLTLGDAITHFAPGAASTSTPGIVELATASDVETGTDTSKVITPKAYAEAKAAAELARTSYRFLQTVEFTTNGTFTKASYAGFKAARIRVQAAGGAGGGSVAASSGNHSAGSGGGGGGYAESFLLDASIPTSVSVTVPDGGTGVSGGTGNTPSSNTSFGTLVVASPGTGGSASANSLLSVSATPGAAGSGITGDLLTSGSAGGMAGGTGTLGISGHGGSSLLGGGGSGRYSAASAASQTGIAGGNYGGGGGGAATNTTGAAAAGGNGAPSIILIDIYV